VTARELQREERGAIFLKLSNNFLMLQAYFMIERMGLGRLSKL